MSLRSAFEFEFQLYKQTELSKEKEEAVNDMKPLWPEATYFWNQRTLIDHDFIIDTESYLLDLGVDTEVCMSKLRTFSNRLWSHAVNSQ